MYFYWIFVSNFIWFMVSNRIMAMKGEDDDGKIPDPTGGHLSAKEKYPLIDRDPIPSAPPMPVPMAASAYGHGDKEDLSNHLGATHLENESNRLSDLHHHQLHAGQQAHIHHAALKYGHGSHQQPAHQQMPHNLMADLLLPKTDPKMAGSSSSLNSSFPVPAPYPPIHHVPSSVGSSFSNSHVSAHYPPMHPQYQQQQFVPLNIPNDPFIINDKPFFDRPEASKHFTEFLDDYNTKLKLGQTPITLENIYPLSMAQLQAGISQLEILYKIRKAGNISSDNKLNELLIALYNSNNFATQTDHPKILYRTDFLSKMFGRANRQTVHAIAIDVGMGRPHFFAMLLAQKMDILSHSLNTNDAHVDVQRILITRFGIDLKEIADAYKNIKGRKTLLTELEEIHGKMYFKSNKSNVARYIEIVKTVSP